MNRLVAVVTALLFVLGVALGQARPAELTYTFFEERVRGVRDRQEFFAPVEQLERIGWSASSRGDIAKVAAEGETFDVGIVRFQDRPHIPITDILRRLGARLDWSTNFDSLKVTSPVFSISAKKGQVQVRGALAIRPAVTVLATPMRVIVDLQGAFFDSKTTVSMDPGATVTQYGSDVRVTVPVAFSPQLPKGVVAPSQKLSIDFNPPVSTSMEEVPNLTIKNSGPGTQVSTGTAPELLEHLPVLVDLDQDTLTTIALGFPKGFLRKPAELNKVAPDKLELIIPGVVLGLPENFQLQTEKVASVSTQFKDGNTILKINLRRPLWVRLVPTEGGGKIMLSGLSGTNGSLAGKTVVIDPGHGAHDSGCRFGALKEKDLTLAISNVIREELTRAGANVIMTRESDIYPSLTERPNLANMAGADFFISIHINAPGRKGSNPSGIQTYYHMQREDGKTLGNAIHQSLIMNCGLPDLKCRSDRTLYSSGLAVLRASKVPAVLLELGFITHPTDRAKMQTEAFRKNVAKSVIEGLRIYLQQ